MPKPHPAELAAEFLQLDADGFRTFWTVVLTAMNDDDSDAYRRFSEHGKTIGRASRGIAKLYYAVLDGAAKAER